MLYLTIITLALHAIIAIGAISAWKKVAQTAPATLPRLFFAISILRLLASVALFAVCLFLIHEDRDLLKQFTVMFLAIYLVMLVIDTTYFYKATKRMGEK
jgi:uncharacterized membrane protein